MDDLRLTARKIFRSGLSAVDPYKDVHNRLVVKNDMLILGGELQKGREYDLRRFRRVFVLGAGKASVPMAAACEEILQKRISKGIIVTKYGHSGPLKYITIVEAGHPVPDKAGLHAAQDILTLLNGSQTDDLIIFLTSGGCSALLPLPVPPITLSEKKRLTNLLLKSGATIKEINAVRKHISMTKGGGLAKQAHPSTVINLILSDVVGDNLDVIGSGPFVPDSSTFQVAWDVLEKYNLKSRLPESIIKHLRAGLEGKVQETPKPGQPCFRKVYNLIIGSNLAALKAAENKAKSLGLKTLILSSQIQGEAGELAGFYAAIAKEILQSGYPSSTPICILAGGEPTVTVKGKGLGGRNTELALSVAIEIQGVNGISFLSGGTDGTDGPTDAAGAIVSGSTYGKALKKGLKPESYLAHNDSYNFFKKTGGLLITGPTGTNVMDIHIMLIG
ncbi:MAG: glycerate kinase [Desulfovibrionales bacterium]|nr:glycerate kinase [Desulfovibrionales bacterium]